MPHAVAFSSGTAALHGAAFAAGLGEGDELVTSAITFAASANCGAYVGATPALRRHRPDDLERLGGDRSRRPRAARPAPWSRSTSPACRRRSAEIREAVGDDVTIIEDAAHALGARTRR